MDTHTKHGIKVVGKARCWARWCLVVMHGSGVPPGRSGLALDDLLWIYLACGVLLAYNVQALPGTLHSAGGRSLYYIGRLAAGS
jgi:hypothetical protein